MNRFTIRKTVLIISALLIAYYIILELYFYYFVGTSYARFQLFLDVDMTKYIESKLLFVFILILSIYVSKRSEFVYSVFIFFSILFLLPSFVTYSFQNQNPAPLYATIALLTSLGLVSVQKIYIPKIRSITLSRGVILGLIMLVLIPFIYSFGLNLNFKNILLEDIFKTREYYDENSTKAVNYLYNWLVKAVIPVLIVYFLIRKQYRYGLITLFILLYLYLISGNKIVFITLFLMLFFFYFGSDSVEKTKYFLILLIAGLMVIPLIDLFILQSHSLKGTIVMRTLFLPSHLNYFYFDFFADKPLFYSESNFFKWFLDYPYEKPVGFIISEKYFAATDMNSNNGIISDGYMNLGYWGVAINILLVSFIFLFFNSLDLDARYLGIFFVMVFLFLSAPMLSMIITSGLWIIALMSLTIMRQNVK